MNALFCVDSSSLIVKHQSAANSLNVECHTGVTDGFLTFLSKKEQDGDETYAYAMREEIDETFLLSRFAAQSVKKNDLKTTLASAMRCL